MVETDVKSEETVEKLLAMNFVEAMQKRKPERATGPLEV